LSDLPLMGNLRYLVPCVLKCCALSAYTIYAFCCRYFKWVVKQG